MTRSPSGSEPVSVPVLAVSSVTVSVPASATGARFTLVTVIATTCVAVRLPSVAVNVTL